tara:strand:+ start:4694 stop:5698 length:1005 start_codon:yes stop_codon:yes gene_type:complete
MLKTILIGFGNIAANYADDKCMKKWIKYSSHIQVLKDNPNFLVKAVVDSKLSALKKAKDLWNIPEVKQNIDELNNPHEFEVAVLAIPAERRIGIIKKLPNLKAIIFEKPLANKFSEGLEINEICRNKNIIAEVNFPRRFDKKLLKIIKKIPGELGTIQTAFGIYGNGINNNGSHLIDLARMFFGKVSWVQSLANKRVNEDISNNSDKNFPFALGFKSGTTLLTQVVNYEEYREFYLDLWGVKGRRSFLQEGLISAYYPLKKHRFSDNDNEIASDDSFIEFMDQGNAMYNLYEKIFSRIKSNDLNNKNLEYALNVLEIIKKLEFSLNSGDERIYL